jgi:16S rRNA (cytosine1402-N4)-methyltransferase
MCLRDSAARAPHVTDFDHEPVLLEEVLAHLPLPAGGVCVDGTLGGAGHAAAILDRHPAATLVGIDRDPAALEAARAHLGERARRAHLVHGAYGDLAAILRELGIERVHAILLDLGVSSPQLDVAERGFSFAKPGPLDMRMDPTRGRTALELLRELDAEALGDAIAELGEERHARKIARLVKEAVREDRVRTTTELAAIVAQAIPIAEQRRSKIHPATRTFQALRIAVNAELEQLAALLEVFPELLAPGGRCAIISFHSLEDRLVKNRFRDLAWTTSLPRRLAEQAGERVDPVCELVTRKAIFATEAEVAENPRARSARLRVCERTAAPNVPARRS